MIEQELLFLGLLRESPRHGYEIKMKIREIIAIFAGLDINSIYYPLGVLEKKGLVSKKKMRQGKRPERIVYELTPKGAARFQELLEKSFFDFTRPRFSLDLSLYFLHYLKPPVARRRLRARMMVLEKLSRDLAQMSSAAQKDRSSALVHILQHNLQMVETESHFLAHLISTL